MPIVPDTKNWTWVLDKPCPECGFDASTFSATDVAAKLRDNAEAWVPVLNGADLTVRPNDSTWSKLEYAAHVRDVFALYLTRLQLMLAGDDPLFANWDQDATAIEEKYNEQDPATVAVALVERAHALADAFEAVPGDAWQRPGRRSDGVAFTIETFAKYFIHDPVHHLWDVTR